MGLLYFGVGAWMVTLGSYLMAPAERGGLAFSPGLAAWVYSAYAVAGVTAPLFIGLLADRLFRAERVLGVACLVGGGAMAGAGVWCEIRQPFAGQPGAADAAFGPLFALLVLHCLAQHIAMTVLNVVALRNLPDARRRFGLARLWGTVGWIAAGNAVALALHNLSAGPLFLAAGAYFLCGLYSFTLPRTPPLGHGKTLAEAFGVRALGLLRRRSFRVLIPAAFLAAVLNQFYVLYAHRFLGESGWKSPEQLMTLGQVTEVFVMLALPLLDPKRWAKWLMVLGLAGYAVRAAALAWGGPAAVVLLGVPPHGTGFALFFVVASMTVDAQAPDALKASAQGMLVFVTGGVGSWAGNLLAAVAVAAVAEGGGVDWVQFWAIAAAGSAALTLLFALLYPAASPRRGG